MSDVIRKSDGTNYVAGDSISVQRDVTGVVVTDGLAEAWLTFKVNPTDADPGALQKDITTTQVSGTGQIAQTGAAGDGDGTGSLLFQLTPTETATLGAGVLYYYDVQVKAASGNIYTPEVGTMELAAGITVTTA
jgi:hypothetical protein